MNRRFLLLTSALVLASCAPGEAPPTPAEEAGEVPAASPAASQEPDEGPRGPRVVFLGTSLTAGLGLLHQSDTYVARLSAMADSAGLPVDAVNAGVSGDTSAGGLRRLDWILGQPLDILVVELGANDGLRGQDPRATAENLRRIVDETRSRYPDAAVYLAAMEAPPNLGDSYTERFRGIFPTVAGETGAGLIPFLLDGIAGVPELNQDDGIHPTAEGHRMMAGHVWAALEPAVKAWWDENPAGGDGS